MPERMARQAGRRRHPVRFRQQYPYFFEVVAVLNKIEPLAWFQAMRTARATIKGFEVMRMFKKG